jgi:WD40 repeat protein/energy-coupling factor transporter ATP-binding protein EcfA2
VNETSINTDVSGGTVGVVGARVVRIENLYVGAASTERATPAGPIPPCPYPGLAYFGPEDASRFFGREQAISGLVAAVAKRSFTALVGASGSGKSSVVLAGLAPRLSAQGGWRSTYFRIGTEPDKNPFAALARALEPLTTERGLSDRLEEVQKLSQKLAAGSISLTNYIGQCRSANPGKRILLIADQFEEAFTFVSDDALRNLFINALIDAFPDPKPGATPDVCLILTLRADFYNAALRYRPLADRLQDHVENLGPMTRDEFREAIGTPADAVHVGFEPGLVDTILDDVEKRPGSLPLLQFALREMWGRLKTPLLTRAGYDAIGGVEGALSKRAQAIFEDATKNETDAVSVGLFRRLFTRLVTLGEGAEDTRRITAKEELGPDEWSLAQKLADEDNRLVVTASTASGQETAEVVHEALIRNWPELVNWVSRDRAFISWRNQLRSRLDEWRASPSDPGTLLRGGPLAVAEEWAARRGDDLNVDEKAYIARSIELRDAERQNAEEELREKQAQLQQMAGAQRETEQAQRRTAEAQATTSRAQRRARRAILAVGVVTTVLLVAGGLFLSRVQRDAKELGEEQSQLTSQQDQLAKAQSVLKTREEQLGNAQSALNHSEKALDEQLTAVGELKSSLETRQIELQHQHANLLNELAGSFLARGNVDAALRFAIKGTEDDLQLSKGRERSTAASAALAAAAIRVGWRLVISTSASVYSASSSADGTRIVTGASKSAQLWDAVTGREIIALEKGTTHPAFSPDGSMIAVADGSTVFVDDARTGKERAVLQGHTDTIGSISFSPDGLRIITSSWDKTARIWDATTAKEIGVLRGHDDWVWSAEFNRSGSLIVTSSKDGTVRVWDPKTYKAISVLKFNQEPIFDAHFSPDGSKLVMASADETARIWDIKGGKTTALLRGHQGLVVASAFSPNGSLIVTASADRTIRIWETETGLQVATLVGHEGGVNSVSFTPDGLGVVSASSDNTVRVWDISAEATRTVLRGHTAEVHSAEFSLDGSRVITSSADKTARAWDTNTGQILSTLSGHVGDLWYAAFNPNGTKVVTASADGTARVWDVMSSRQVAVLSNTETLKSVFNTARYSPDGSLIVTALRDNTARIWRASTGEEIAVLRGHRANVSSAAFNRDGSRVVTSSWDGTARIWDVATAKEIAVLDAHGDLLWDAEFSPDGSSVVIASEDETARIWDIAQAKEIALLRGHANTVRTAAFSSDGSRVVTASFDGTARIWDAKTAHEIVVLRGDQRALFSAAFNRNGSLLVTSSDKVALIWDVRLATMTEGALLSEVCLHKLTGLSKLTRDEMRLAGYPDSEQLIDVCAGIAEARP